MYSDFANELVKTALSSRALYKQEQADREFNALQSSSRPGSLPKAFAKGFATGASIPMFLSASSFLGDRLKQEGIAEAQIRKAHISEYLKSVGSTRPQEAAEAIVKATFPTGRPPTGSLDIPLQDARIKFDQALESGKADIPKGRNLSGDPVESLSATQAKKRFRSYAEELGSGMPDSRARSMVYPKPDRLWRPDEVAAIERLGGDIYKKNYGKSLSVNKLMLQNFGKHMLRAGQTPLILGGILGAMSLRKKQKARKVYQNLSRRAAQRK